MRSSSELDLATPRFLVRANFHHTTGHRCVVGSCPASATALFPSFRRSLMSTDTHLLTAVSEIPIDAGQSVRKLTSDHSNADARRLITSSVNSPGFPAF
jgi:hypothetical protein